MEPESIEAHVFKSKSRKFSTALNSIQTTFRPENISTAADNSKTNQFFTKRHSGRPALD
jgi:hypothetical protein